MISFDQLMEGIRSAPVPVGFGLLTVNWRSSGTEIIEVTRPRFMYALPIPLEDHPMKLVLVPRDALELAVADLDAQPLGPEMPYWYRFAVWEEHEHRH